MEGFFYNQSVKLSACDQAVYQQDVVIHRTAGVPYEELVGGLYVLHFYVGDKCKADYGDIRFTDGAGTELAYYLWPDHTADAAQFCVRLAGADIAGQMVIWYGNQAAETTSDGDATYTYFRNFDAPEEISDWTVKSGSWSVTNGLLQPGTTGSHTFIQSSFSSSGSYVAETAGTSYILCVQSQSETDQYQIHASSGIIYKRVSGKFTQIIEFPPCPDRVIVSVSGGTTTISDGVNFISDSTFSSGHVGFDGYYGGAEYLHIRAYSATPPTATAFGPEQRVRSGGGIALGSANMMVI